VHGIIRCEVDQNVKHSAVENQMMQISGEELKTCIRRTHCGLSYDRLAEVSLTTYSCMNIIFNSLLAQLVKYDVHTMSKIKFIHAIFITYYYFIANRTCNTTVTASSEYGMTQL